MAPGATEGGDRKVARSFVRFPLAFLLGVLVPSGVFAQANMGPAGESGRVRRVGLSFGFFLPSYNTDLLVSGPDGDGTGVDLEDDLGFAASDAVFRFDGLLRLADRHHLGFSWITLDRDSSKVIEEEIAWDDVIFQLGSQVKAFFDFDIYKVHYRYTAFRRGTVDLGLGGGISYMSFHFGASGLARLAGEDEERYFEASRESNVDVPVPALGADVRWAIRPDLFLLGNIAYLRGSYDGRKARYSDTIVALIWYPWNNVGFGAMYNWFKITYQDESREFRGRFDYRYSGPVVSLNLVF